MTTPNSQRQSPTDEEIANGRLLALLRGMGANDPMREGAQNLHGRCVLIVEDEYFLADDLVD